MSRAYGEPVAEWFTLLGVVIQQPTETLVSTHSTDAPFCRRALDQFVG
jgi:hypothetical protein